MKAPRLRGEHPAHKLCAQDAHLVHDILIVPAQTGFRYRGRSMLHAREAFSVNEFGLGSFDVAILLLTHPERLQRWEELYIDCPGDDYSGLSALCFNTQCFGPLADGDEKNG